MEDSESCISSVSSSAPSKSARPLMLPPCRVCGEKGTGFHYGQNTCEGCKAFFSRSTKRTQAYKCFGSGSCDIGPDQKRLCPRCRLCKCFAVGMSKKAIQTGRYKLEKHTQNILKVKELQRGNLAATEPAMKSPSKQQTEETLCIRFSDKKTDHTSSSDQQSDHKSSSDQKTDHTSSSDHKSSSDQKTDQQQTDQKPSSSDQKTDHISFPDQQSDHKSSSDQKTDHTSSIVYLPSLYDDIIHAVVEVHDVSLPSVLMSTERTMQIQKQYHEEYTLRQELFGPQAVLSKEQYEDIYQTTGIDIDDRKKMLTHLLEDTEYMLKGIVNFVKSAHIFSELTIADKSRLFKAATMDFLFLEGMNGYNKALQVYVNPLGRCYHADEIQKLKDYIILDPSFIMYGRKLKLKHEEIVVIMAICILSTDRCDLDDPQKVADLQWKLTQCLMHLLEKNHPGHTRLFSGIIDQLAWLRKALDISLKKYPSLKSWPNIEKFPLCCEISNDC